MIIGHPHTHASMPSTTAVVFSSQAAGAAAALAAVKDGDVRALDVKALQRRLKELGAYLPNA